MAAASPELLRWLQRALAHEWAAAEQFLMQSAIAKAQGMDAFAAFSRDSAREELEHAGLLATHLAQIGRSPRVANSVTFDPGRDGPSMLVAAIDTERRAVELYTQAAHACRGWAHWAAFFSGLAHEEERHRRELEGWQERLGLSRRH